jgi:hypothetical protein
MIILDRVQWLREQLVSDMERPMNVRIVNVFDQTMGSGRNIALVLSPYESASIQNSH